MKKMRNNLLSVVDLSIKRSNSREAEVLLHLICILSRRPQVMTKKTT
jgi:hypothetical protein